MYALLVPTVAIAATGVWRRVRQWRHGKPIDRLDRPIERLAMVARHVLAQGRTIRKSFAGPMHAMVFWGFIILTIATTVVMIDYDLGVPIMRGDFYLYFQSFIVDVFGSLVLVGVGMAAWRRIVRRPRELVYTDESLWILGFVFVIGVTGYLLEGWRIAVTNDPWGKWSPIGYLVAILCRPILSDTTMRTMHLSVWWFHLALVFGFIAWAPYTKMLHVLTAPLNVYTASLAPIGAALKPIDFEAEGALGVKDLSGFTWKDLLDLDACTECGRCTEVCPANTVGKLLSPRDIILDLRGLMRRDATTAANSESNDPSTTGVGAAPILQATPALSSEALWQCTTCAACVEACPVFIEQMPKIVDMRRYLVMEEADFPPTMQEAMASLENRGHPFRGSRFSRLDWTEGLSPPTLGEGVDAEQLEVLLWVGCGGSLVERNQRTTRALAQLLEKAGIKYAILGREEKCTGDPARRVGNEFLFDSIARENIETLNGHAVKKVVTACPHCFNTFKNEYPRLGGEFEVRHHSEFLAELVESGKLKVKQTSDKKTTFHDPCYLGRQNGVYDAPRQLVQITTSQPVVEMSSTREGSFCCGGGGGMSFIDEPAGQRVNQHRARQALATGAEVVAVGCPFCMTQLEDGVNGTKGDRDVQVRDIAEILLDAVASETPVA